MLDLKDGETVEMQGSGSKPYILKNVGGVYSCTCASWRNQSKGIERRTCKHLIRLRGDAAEMSRLGSLPPAPVKSASKAIPPPLLLAEVWDRKLDPTGWWVSEKLDGVRAYWDGKQLISRLGNVFQTPDWFTQNLVKTHTLDGELYQGHGQFQRTSGLVRRHDKGDGWKGILYKIFDVPSMGKKPFEIRMNWLRQSHFEEGGQNEYCKHVHQMPCEGMSHLLQTLQQVERAGGEGLMLREPGSLYVAGRSSTLLKVKTALDGEATVIGHEPGKGRHKGRLGALRCKLGSGVEFAVGTGLSDVERKNPPAIGAVITFKYKELTSAGVPREPAYVCLAEEK